KGLADRSAAQFFVPSSPVAKVSPSPNLGLGEGARRADEGRGAKRSGRAASATGAHSRAGSHPALRATFSHASRGRRGTGDTPECISENTRHADGWVP